VADLLKVDLDTLVGLGHKLGGHANEINAIDYTVTVWMSDGPIAKAFEDTRTGVTTAYRSLGGRIGRMSEMALTGARTYEAVETFSAEQLRQYNAGQ
jgi:hypothetical protein